MRRRRRGDQEGTSDGLGGGAANFTQRQGDACFFGKARVAAGEDWMQAIIFDRLRLSTSSSQPSASLTTTSACSVASYRPRSRLPRRIRSMQPNRPVKTSQANGLADTPWLGHCSAAATEASCSASSAASQLPNNRTCVEYTRRLSCRNNVATNSFMAADQKIGNMVLRASRETSAESAPSVIRRCRHRKWSSPRTTAARGAGSPAISCWLTVCAGFCGTASQPDRLGATGLSVRALLRGPSALGLEDEIAA